MTNNELDTLASLYMHARDAYEKDNWEHRHLKGALIDAAGLLHKYKRIDDGLLALIYETLDPAEDDTETT